MNSSAENFNPYKILNLSEDASQKEVKSRFYSLSRAFHPDKQPPELVRESAQQFEKIEQAYKILSTPMRKYVFDKYGIEGVRVCNEKARKLGDIEEEYKEVAHHHDVVQYDDAAGDIDKLESKAELRLAQERVRRHVEYHHKRLEEEHMTTVFAKEIAINNTIGIGNLVDYYIKKTPHSMQARERGIRPRVDFSNLYMHHWLLLPEYKGMQHMLGVYGNFVAAKYETSYGFKYRFRKVVPKLGDSEVVGVLQYGDENKEASLNVTKVFASGIGGTIGVVIGEQGFRNASFSANKGFSEHLSMYTQTHYDGDAEMLTGISKEFKKYNLKFDNALQIGADKVRLGQTLTKQISQRLVAFTSLNTYFLPSPLVQGTLGFSYQLSSMSKFSFSTNLTAQAISWELRYTRLALKLKLPIFLGKNVTRDVFLFSLGVLATLFYGTYLFDKFRKRTATHLKKLERKHRSRLMDGRRALNSFIGESSIEVGNRTAAEIDRDGVVVLKAFYGYPSYVRSLYQQELKKWGYTRRFRPNLSAGRLIADAIQENKQVVDSDVSELVDLRPVLQMMVHNSELKFSLESLEQARGVFNPCLDDTNQPYLLLVVSMNHKVFVNLIQKRTETVVFSADYDKFIREAEVESRNSAAAYVSSIGF